MEYCLKPNFEPTPESSHCQNTSKLVRSKPKRDIWDMSMSKSILDMIHCSYKTSVLQCSRTHENANNRQYVYSVENLFSQILWESTRWHSLVIFLSYLKKLGTYIILMPTLFVFMITCMYFYLWRHKLYSLVSNGFYTTTVNCNIVLGNFLWRDTDYRPVIL